MKHLIILLIMLNASLLGQNNWFFWDDTTNTTYGGELKVPQYAVPLNGTTQYLSKTSPTGLDLNGAEMVTNAINTGMEVGSEVITNGSFGSNITGWTSGASTPFWYNTDWNAVGRTNCLLDSATGTSGVNATATYNFVSGVRYKLTYTYYIPSSNTTTTKIRARLIGTSNPYLTIFSGTDSWLTATEYFIPVDNKTAIAFYQVSTADVVTGITVGDKIYIDDVSIKPVSYWATNGTATADTSSTRKYAGSYSLRDVTTGVGDSTTNYMSLAATNFTAIESGKKYTAEYWVNAVGKAGTNIIPDSNSSFTTWGLSYWSVGNGSYSHNDSGWVVLNSTTTGYLYKSTYLAAGQTYEVAFSAKSAGYRNKIYSYAGTYVASTSLLSGNISDVWQRFSGKVTYNGGGTLYLQLLGSYSGTVDIDSISVKLYTKPTYTMVIGDKASTSDTISIIPGVFEKVVFNFQATASTVGQAIKIYCSQADTGYFDSFSLTNSKDVMLSTWVKPGTPMTYGGIHSIFSGEIASSDYRIPTLKVYGNSGTATNAYTPQYIVGGSSQSFIDNPTSQKVDTTAWNLLTMIVNRTAPYSKIYMNGVIKDSISIANLGVCQATAAGIAIGRRMYSAAQYWIGQIGEIQYATFNDISTVNYTPAQLYTRGKNSLNFPSSYTGGVISAWYKWNNSFNDASASANHLTGSGSPTIIEVDY